MSENASQKSKIVLPVEFSDESGGVDFVNQFVVSADGPEVHIYACILVPPVFIQGSEEDWRSQVQSIHSVQMKCVRHLVMSKDRVKSLLKALSSQLDAIEKSGSDDQVKEEAAS